MFVLEIYNVFTRSTRSPAKCSFAGKIIHPSVRDKDRYIERVADVQPFGTLCRNPHNIRFFRVIRCETSTVMRKTPGTSSS